MQAAANLMVELVRTGQDATVVEVDAGRVAAFRGVEPTTGRDRLDLEYPSSRRVRINLETEGTRLLVVHDSWDRGWRATLDGEPVEIVPVNVLSRGVIVPAGEHRVEMWFRPRGTVMGAAGSLVGIAMCLIVGHAARKRLGSS
jgi:uncharacterized membrane protein YfhO